MAIQAFVGLSSACVTRNSEGRFVASGGGQRRRACICASHGPPPKVAFLGAGNMAEAIVKGLVASEAAEKSGIFVSTRNPGRRDEWGKSGVMVAADNVTAAKSADVVFLSVKPYGIVDLIGELRRSKQVKDKLFISIAAGVTLAAMEDAWPAQRFVRVMPNTPSLVGYGASVFARGQHVTGDDAHAVELLLSSVGTVSELPERLIDSATGISGSGPAYVYILIEALSDAGVLQGLPRKQALHLAAQTVLGSAKMVMENDHLHPAQLRNAVESPGGCTIAAVRALEEGNLRATIYDAVEAVVETAKGMA